ncbi:MAG: hypothetical protein WA771_08050 [Chthoniobacterales bacterium]
MKLKVLFIAAAIAVSTTGFSIPSAQAQSGSLTTQFGPDTSSGDEGMMFDILALRPLTVTGVQFAFENLPLTDSVEIFTKPGSYVGSEAAPGNWTLNGAGLVTVSALEAPSPILFLSSPVALPAGGQIGMNVLRDSGSGPNVATEPGTQSGTVAAFDANLIIFEGIDANGNFVGPGTQNRIPHVTVHYTLTDLAAPTVSVIGANRIRATEPRVRIDGIASDDVGINSVRVRFKRQRNNGTTRKVTRFLPFDPTTGLFRIKVRTFVGRNPVRFNVTDTAGKASATAKAVIIRKD